MGIKSISLYDLPEDKYLERCFSEFWPHIGQTPENLLYLKLRYRNMNARKITKDMAIECHQAWLRSDFPTLSNELVRAVDVR